MCLEIFVAIGFVLPSVLDCSHNISHRPLGYNPKAQIRNLQNVSLCDLMFPSKWLVKCDESCILCINDLDILRCSILQLALFIPRAERPDVDVTMISKHCVSYWWDDFVGFFSCFGQLWVLERQNTYTQKHTQLLAFPWLQINLLWHKALFRTGLLIGLWAFARVWPQDKSQTDGYRPLWAPLLHFFTKTQLSLLSCTKIFEKLRLLQCPKSESPEEHLNDKSRTSSAALPVAGILSTNKNKA